MYYPLLNDILFHIKWTLTILTSFCFLYYIFLGLFSFKKIKTWPKITDKKHRFAVVIPARNEEKVIGFLIDSLHAQVYDKTLFDIFVLADNCTDRTAEYAMAKGAAVYERFDSTKQTKGFALSWFFDKFFADHKDKYDAVCMFDADNVADKSFLSEMNEQLCMGKELAQGYSDAKNPSDSWISGSYALFFYTNMRFLQRPKYNLGLSCMLRGTGFMVRTSVLEESGWNTSTMCEDIEFSLYKIAEGRKISFAHKAKFYDEHPVSFKQSWRQRMRWTAGNFMCIFKCGPKLITNKKITRFQALDSIMFLLAIPCVIGSAVSVLLDVVLNLLNIQNLIHTYPLMLLFLSASFITTLAQGLIVALLEKKKIKPLLKGILMYPFFMLSYIIITVWGTIKQDKIWKPIIHAKTFSIEDIKERHNNKKKKRADV